MDDKLYKIYLIYLIEHNREYLYAWALEKSLVNMFLEQRNYKYFKIIKKSLTKDELSCFMGSNNHRQLTYDYLDTIDGNIEMVLTYDESEVLSECVNEIYDNILECIQNIMRSPETTDDEYNVIVELTSLLTRKDPNSSGPGIMNFDMVKIFYNLVSKETFFQEEDIYET